MLFLLAFSLYVILLKKRKLLLQILCLHFLACMFYIVLLEWAFFWHNIFPSSISFQYLMNEIGFFWNFKWFFRDDFFQKSHFSRPERVNWSIGRSYSRSIKFCRLQINHQLFIPNCSQSHKRFKLVPSAFLRFFDIFMTVFTSKRH